jgi:hypothetical protein
VTGNDEFDVPIGVRILSTQGKSIRIQDDNGEVCIVYSKQVMSGKSEAVFMEVCKTTEFSCG